MTDSAVADHAAPDRPSRRTLLGAGVVGAAMALAGSRSASAAAGSSDADHALVEFAVAIELAARDLYDAAIAAGADDPIWTTMREHHESYAQRLAGIDGIPAKTADATLFDSYADAFATSDPAAAGVELENVLAATHTELLAELSDVSTAGAVASIVSIESRHATVLAVLAGDGDDLDALFPDTATPLSPEA